eukprot:CAMPEP_0119321800 /NCGR_PEP_ID=MMETSP1333-20130426/56473_1 /TAXON_ID=418940 /ORGANISM="Scyphosphaera apsteinii, Strain RCC1455" /LENGTH=77 /DNA_ID=CAMNT_0007328863 /DNA_START=47 /DNA_END=277 /DNA_ORIENTATION=+
MVNYDDDDFADFMSRVDDVTATISGIKDGSIDVKAFDKKEAEAEKKAKESAALKERKRREAQEKAEAEARKKAAEAK